jgi:hypothetical protein
VFGYAMTERNLAGFRLVKDSAAELLRGYRHELSYPFGEAWLLVPTDSGRSESLQALAWWTDGTDSLPGITANPCGRGWGILVPYFLLLQPSIDGGAGDIPAISSFYRGLFKLALGEGPEVFVNPWPGPYRAALSLTLNEAGEPLPDSGGLARTLDRLLKAPGVRELDVFVTGGVSEPALDRLRTDSRLHLASLGFSHARFLNLDYCRAVWELARLEDLLGVPVRGFRFPFSDRTAAGMFALARRGYRFDSSIFLDHATGFAGALFPYRLPVWAAGQYCVVADVLELSPALEDWEFYGAGAAAPDYPEEDQVRDARRFGARLQSAWQDLALARRGMMVLSLHAAYCGLSDATFGPVSGLLAGVAEEGDAWVAGLERIADWWDTRGNVDIRVGSEPGRTVLSLTNRNPEPIRGFTVRLADPELRVRASGIKPDRVEREEEDGTAVYLTFDLGTTGRLEVYR